jgi:hypothetical protein
MKNAPFENANLTLLILRHFTLAAHECLDTQVRGIGHLFNTVATLVDQFLITLKPHDLSYRMSNRIPIISAPKILQHGSECLDAEIVGSLGTGTMSAFDPQDILLLFEISHLKIRQNTTSRHIRHLGFFFLFSRLKVLC